MRFVVLAAGALLAGCVQPAYVPPPPIQLQPYPPPVTYRIDPSERPPTPAPLAEPLPQPLSPAEAPTAPPSDDTGAIPLQQMPPPAPDTQAPTDTSTAPATPPAEAPAPVVARTPTTGPGSNVPLEGFRPMHSQTRPAP